MANRSKLEAEFMIYMVTSGSGLAVKNSRCISYENNHAEELKKRQ